MYSMVRDAYTCDKCGFEEKWDAHDDIHGDIWECDRCGRHFCTACFVKELGRKAFDHMMQEMDLTVCAEHYREQIRVG